MFMEIRANQLIHHCIYLEHLTSYFNKLRVFIFLKLIMILIMIWVGRTNINNQFQN